MKASKSPVRLGFTLVEVLVSIVVLVILMVMIAQLFSSANLVIGSGNKRMDTDAQARALLDRMGLDIAAMVKRSDVDYYLKGRPAANSQPGNDQLAFYSEVAGYYPATGAHGSMSFVGYRLNPGTFKIERFSKGLVWNGVSKTDTPMVFLPIPVASPIPIVSPSPVAAVPSAIPTPAWPKAAEPGSSDPAAVPDSDYEDIGSPVLRFEYYYVLKGAGTTTPPLPLIASITPWDVRPPLSHTSINGLQDITALTVAIAIIDPKSRVIVSHANLSALTAQMKDFSNTMKPGELEAQWQAVINASTIPRSATAGIRIYARTFYLNTSNPTIP